MEDDTRLADELVRVTQERDRMIFWLVKLYVDRSPRRPYLRPWQHVRRVLEDLGYPPDGDRAAALIALEEPELEDDYEGEHPTR
jgi:hypothetical protein